ncbi:hypothetical protein Y1Q_0015202 [Alligator mississippiensis]|uniref:Uncharacterized protein n=1 Tax=Alligator mississippiensis TaxID=8496 RepID=A0A151P953_ALLMI|nr:hypothetical protein Y1Q_0015202 [Alligator mississippiensis]
MTFFILYLFGKEAGTKWQAQRSTLTCLVLQDDYDDHVAGCLQYGHTLRIPALLLLKFNPSEVHGKSHAFYNGLVCINSCHHSLFPIGIKLLSSVFNTTQTGPVSMWVPSKT